MTGTPYGQQQGRLNGVEYRDDPEIFRAKLTAVSGTKAGFAERWQRPDTGALEDKPGGRTGSTDAAWIVLPSGSPYAVDDEVLARRHPRDSNLYEIVAADGSGSGLVLVKATATATLANTYTTGEVQTTPLPAPADPPEEAVLKPFNSGMLQKAGTYWFCLDTRTTDAYTPPRRQLVGVIPPFVKRRVQAGCSDAGEPLWADVWVPDVNNA